MTSSPFSPLARFTLWAMGLLVLLAIATGAQANRQPPPPAFASAPVGRTVPVSPLDTVLYSQLDNQSTYGVSAQNFEPQSSQYDAMGAVDFTIPSGGGINAWQVYTIEVAGLYFTQTAYVPSVTSITVQFMANNNGAPSAVLYSAEPATVGSTSSGYLVVRLGTPAVLGAGNTYWLGLQANKSYNTGFWLWRERTVLGGLEAYWRNPLNGYGYNCVSWTLIRTCTVGDNHPELAFSLAGNTSNDNATPVLSSLTPDAAANQGFLLELAGANFKPGTTVQWTDGSTTQLGTADYIDGNHIEITVPQNLTTNINANVSVKVTVPGPCNGSCESNTLTFKITNRRHLPRVTKGG